MPFEKVSINKIVKDADISRGSCYMYFENKKDMLGCVLSNYHDELMSTIKESFNKNKQTTVDIFMNIKERDEILEEYKNKITILQRGMLKEKL